MFESSAVVHMEDQRNPEVQKKERNINRKTRTKDIVRRLGISNVRQ